MDLGYEKNLEIAKKFCLNPEGCPRLKGCKDYTERMTKCASCTNYLNKVDLIDLLRHLTSATDLDTSTTTDTPPRVNPPRTGKGTELNKSQIKNILSMYYIDKLSMTKIGQELHIQFRTVKNVVTQGFKNETSNAKVQLVIEEMGLKINADTEHSE